MSKNVSGVVVYSKAVILIAIALSFVFSSTEPVDAGKKGSGSSNPAAPPPAYPNVKYDFDGDGKADIGRWQKSATNFRVRETDSGNLLNYTLGSTTAIAAPGDFNGDGVTDAGTFAAGTWTFELTPGGTEGTISWGQAGDIPVAGNYDSHAVTDAAVFRPASATWYILNSGGGNTTTQYGASSDIPIPGDYDGDSLTDIAVFRPSTGYWYVQKSGGGSIAQQWGQSGDVPLQGDFDGDGKSDPAVFRPSTGYWYLAKSSTGYSTWLQMAWGNWSDQPAPADYNGDGITDYCVWRPTTGMWYIHINDTMGDPDHPTPVSLGIAGDTAVPSAYTKQVGGSVGGDVMAAARLDPKNATGGTNLYSQNFGWGTSLVGLPGRSGLDAGFGISYNSLVWAKYGSTMYFDPDNSNVTPGFRMGFPVVEPIYYNGTAQKWSYMMLMPDGTRKEFRQTSVSDTYETADSTYSQLVLGSQQGPNTAYEDVTLTFKTTDGTQASYSWVGGAYRCTQIKDRNGNYITIAYSQWGQLTTMTDTLGRVVTVNYDSGGQPSSIVQTWKESNGSGSTTQHTWATFTYANPEVTTDFEGLTVYGPPNTSTVKALDKITYADGSSTKFEYNGYLQVKKVSNLAPDAHELNYVSTNLASPAADQTDCPRVTATNTKAENFNGGSEVTIYNTAPSTAFNYTTPGGTESVQKAESYVSGHPDQLYTRTYYGASGFKKGIPIASEDCLGTDYSATNCSNQKRWTWSNWTQDNAGVSYITNPRVVESRVGDGSNTKKTDVTYYHDTTTGVRLPATVSVGTTASILKSQTTIYNWDSNYVSRRIIGLPAETNLLDANSTLMSKVTYAYDEGNDASLSSTSQHDGTNYGTSFNYRGNLTSVRRWDVTVSSSESESVASQTAYNIAGSPVSKTDPRLRVTTISYADNWNDASRTTYAYPTSVTDPAGFSSSIEYRYDIGANVEATSPAPAGQSVGKTTSRTFSDTTGRIIKEMIDNTGAYTRYAYATSGNAMTTYTTLIDVNSNNTGDSTDEVTTLTEFDGAGRVMRTRTDDPDTTGGDWIASVTEYDFLGRMYRTSVPTEVSVSGGTWTPAGEDSGNWKWNYTYYDWMGRTTRTVPSDSNGSDGKDTLIEYAGCGCAGGLVTTIKGPVTDAYGVNGQWQTGKRRWQKVYQDLLGRNEKAEQWDLDGQNGTVYTTTKTTFNGRDQATLIREYAGSEYSYTHSQDTTMTYDGHGRLYQKHLPQWYGTSVSDVRYTTYSYNDDDSVSTTIDPRGVVATHAYGRADDVNSTEYRAVLTNVQYVTPSPNPTPPHNLHIPGTAEVTFAYDNAGNRLTMTDGTGSLTYAYDQTSRLLTETKVFVEDPNHSYPLTYEYHLSGGLKSIEDPFDHKVTYTADRMGRMTEIDGPSTNDTYASNIRYRAFGAVKQITMGTAAPTTVTMAYDSALRPLTYDANNTATGTPHVQQAAYSYGNDGLVKEIDNVRNGGFDQKNEYDFAGRLKKNLVGNGGTFWQTLGYDAFSNLTWRETSTYGYYSDSHSTAYSHNRATDSFHDAAGNVVHNATSASVAPQPGHRPYTDTKKWNYDAAGRLAYWSQHGPWGSQTTRRESYKHDGDGRAATKIDTNDVTWHYLFSSVTGEKVVDLNSGYFVAVNNHIYFGATKIADQLYGGSKEFTVTDPVSGSWARMAADGTVPTSAASPPYRSEIAGLGTSVPLTNPYPVTYPEPDYSAGGFVGNAGHGCAIDGQLQPSCNDAMWMLSKGFAHIDWNRSDPWAVRAMGIYAFWNPTSGRKPPENPDPNTAYGDGGKWEYRVVGDRTFDGGTPNTVAQLGDCFFLSVVTYDRIANGAKNVLTNTFGDQAESAYHGWSIYDRAVFLNTTVGMADLGANLTTAKLTGDHFLRYDKPPSENSMGKALSFGLWMSGVTGIRHPSFGGSILAARHGNPGSLEIEKKGGMFHYDFDLHKGPSAGHNEEQEFNKRHRRPTHPGDVIKSIRMRNSNLETGVNCVNIIPGFTGRWFGNEV